MRKKILSLLLSLCLCLSLMPTALAAGTELKVTAPEELPAVGETFTVTVDISGNPGFAALGVTLGYDKSVLKCVDIYAGSALQGAMTVSNPDASKGAIVAAASSKDIARDGNVATYTFEVIAAGDADLTVENVDLSDAHGSDIDYTVTGVAQTPQKPESGETIDPIKPEKPEAPEKPETPEEPEVPAEEAVGFTDTAGHRYEDEIAEAVELGLFQGYADGSFGPERSVTRGAFVTVLWRMAGKPMPTRATPFTDIGKVSTEFQRAIAWAYGNGLIDGRTATTFAPGDPVSRQAALKILYYYNGGVSNVNPLYLPLYQGGFEDCVGKPDWVQTSMFWGYYNELIDAVTQSKLQPAAVATRAQLAKMFVSFTDAFGS